jgi:ubiquinone/menaquinone biosynthesis C-methylase UbiE
MTVQTYDSEAATWLARVYMSPDVVAQRDRTLDILKPQPGERIADIGCGPGYLAQSLADAVGGSGEVHGVDLSADLIAFARAQPDAQRIAYSEGDATDLPLKRDYFDAAVSTQVLEYVADVDKAIAEMFRITKPGGRIVAMATDGDATVYHSSDPDLSRRILKAWQAHCAHPHLPRTLTARLTAAGFVEIGINPHVVVSTEFNDTRYAHGMAGKIRDYVVNQGMIDKRQAHDWHDEFERLAAQGRFYSSTTRYIFTARKPG